MNSSHEGINKNILSLKMEQLNNFFGGIEKEDLLSIFKKVCFNRSFELELKKVYDCGAIKCPIYLSTGQESISATLSQFFKPDLIFTQHRGHSTYLSFGGDVDKLIDELLGRDSGCNQGKGGSPGIQDLNIGMVGHHGLIGENVPLAVGAALGDPSKKVICFFGDGALEEDYVYSAICFAITHKLPILFVCEDNNLSILTEKDVRRNWELADALKGMSMPVADIEDDPSQIAHYAQKYQYNLPAFINCRTCRHNWHVGTGKDGEPRIDRMMLIKSELIQRGVEEHVLEDIENNAKQIVEEEWKKHLEIQ